MGGAPFEHGQLAISCLCLIDELGLVGAVRERPATLAEVVPVLEGSANAQRVAGVSYVAPP